MKTNYIYTLLLAVLCITVSSNVSAMTSFDNDNTQPTDQKPIIIIRKPGGTTIPRSLIPEVEAYYLNGEIYFTFNADLGDVTIDVLNIYTGTSVCDYVDTVCGILIVDISSMGSGEYEIHISNDTTTYYGNLVL